jgi:hypothetical protein
MVFTPEALVGFIALLGVLVRLPIFFCGITAYDFIWIDGFSNGTPDAI